MCFTIIFKYSNVSTFFFSWLYWTDTTTNEIKRASMDGKSISTLHNSSLGYPSVLAIDYGSQKLYWIHNSQLESSNSDGTGRVTIFVSSELGSPQSVSVFGEYLYWTQYQSIYLVPLNSPMRVTTVLNNGLLSNLYGLQIYSKEKQPEGIVIVYLSSMK